MKKLILCLTVISIMLNVSACKGKEASEAGELNIYTWMDYIPGDVIADFENETGIKVNYSNFSNNEEMYSKLKANNASQYDIVLCSDYIIDFMRREGNLIKQLDAAQIPNLENIDGNFRNNYYDPENNLAVPYAVASAILVYDSEKVPFEITSYADLWNEQLKSRVVLLDGDRDIIGLTLQKIGYSVNETDEAALSEALEELVELKPNVVGFNADAPHEMIISGEAWAGYMFGSQATAALAEVPSLKFVYPEEGMALYVDNVIVPYNAPNEQNAYKFINFILDGEVSARISSTINYISTNSAAKEYLPEEFLKNETVNIPDEVLGGAEVYQDIGSARALYDRVWTEFKSN